jgi:FkbM family methyltransferase
MVVLNTIKYFIPKLLYKPIRIIYLFIFYDIKYFITGFFLSFNKYIRIYKLSFLFPKMSYYRLGNYFFNYEKNEIFLISKHLNSNAVVLELGGCIGVVSNKLNSLLFNKMNHVVLEPNIIVSEFLTKNREINNSSYFIENTVISNDKFIDFFIYDDVLWSSFFNRNTKLDKKISIETTNIISLKNKYNLIFDTLVLDIEGAELELLIDNSFINNFISVFVEFHRDVYGNIGYEKCKSSLIANNFEFIERKGDVEFWRKNNISI